MKRRILSTIALLSSCACSMDRELAYEELPTPLTVYSQDLRDACERLDHVYPEMGCDSEHPSGTESAWIRSMVCVDVLRDPSVPPNCMAGRAPEPCLNAAAALVDCIAESRTCNPEQDCADVWVPECSARYPIEVAQFTPACASGSIGYDNVSVIELENGDMVNSSFTFTSEFEECADGHRYGSSCEVDQSCRLSSCSCSIDGSPVATVSPGTDVRDLDSLYRVHVACGFTEPVSSD